MYFVVDFILRSTYVNPRPHKRRNSSPLRSEQKLPKIFGWWHNPVYRYVDPVVFELRRHGSLPKTTSVGSTWQYIIGGDPKCASSSRPRKSPLPLPMYINGELVILMYKRRRTSVHHTRNKKICVPPNCGSFSQFNFFSRIPCKDGTKMDKKD